MKNLMVLSSLIFFLPTVLGSICPLDDDFLCNNRTEHECRCVAPVTTINPIRLFERFRNDEKYCNEIVNTTDSDFEAITIKFELSEDDKDESSEEDGEDETIDEEDLREKIAKRINIKEHRIILLQLQCVDDDSNLTVTFVVLKDAKELDKLRKDVSNSDEAGDDDDDDDDHKAHTGKKVETDDGDNDDDDDDDKDDGHVTKKVEEHIHKAYKTGKKTDDDDESEVKVEEVLRKTKTDEDDDDDDDGKEDKDDSDEDEDSEEDDFEPYKPEHLEPANLVVRNLTRSKSRKGDSIADYKVAMIEPVKALSDFETTFGDNFLLIIVVGLFIGLVIVSLLFLYVIVKKCRTRGYSDTLQRP